MVSVTWSLKGREEGVLTFTPNGPNCPTRLDHKLPQKMTRCKLLHQQPLELVSYMTSWAATKVPGFSPPTSCFASRVDVSRVTPTPHHGITHGSNVLVDKSHSQTPTRVRSAVLENTSSARYQLYYPDAGPIEWESCLYSCGWHLSDKKQ